MAASIFGKQRAVGRFGWTISVIAGLCACGSDDTPSTGGTDGADNPSGDEGSQMGEVPEEGPWQSGAVLPAPPAGTGDPETGKWELLNGSFMSCGIPYKLWDFPVASSMVQEALGEGRPPLPGPGRDGKNADMPYSVTVFTTTDGAEVMNLNCLHCHGGYFNGELILGLGDPSRDFTDGLIGGIPAGSIDNLIPLLGLTDAERASTEKILKTATAINGRTQTNTVGNNPADALAAVIVEHRVPETLEWSEEPLLELVFYDDDGNPRSSEESRFTSDPPPWWRSHKKNSLFYAALTRGDHRGTMSAAAAICVDSVEEAERVDDLFVHIQAFVESTRAPAYPFPIDSELAKTGRALFNQDCAGCHGTYAEDPTADELDTYPNLIIPLDVIGTDPVIAELGNKHLPGVFDVYNSTF